MTSSPSSVASFMRHQLTPWRKTEAPSKQERSITRPFLPPLPKDTETLIESLQGAGRMTSFSGLLLALDDSSGTVTVLSYSQGAPIVICHAPFSVARRTAIRGLRSRRAILTTASTLFVGIRSSLEKTTTFSRSKDSLAWTELASLIQLLRRSQQLRERP